MRNKMSRWHRHTVHLSVDATSKGAVSAIFYASGYPLMGIDEPTVVISYARNNYTEIVFDVFPPTDSEWFKAYVKYAAELYEDD